MRARSKPEIRVRHLNNLAVIFGVSYEEIKVIFKELKGIEMNGHKNAEAYCNGVINADGWDACCDHLLRDLKRLISNKELLREIHLNGDPRGYFLKIDCDYVKRKEMTIEKDWGGYGIICPEGV